METKAKTAKPAKSAAKPAKTSKTKTAKKADIFKPVAGKKYSGNGNRLKAFKAVPSNGITFDALVAKTHLPSEKISYYLRNLTLAGCVKRIAA